MEISTEAAGTAKAPTRRVRNVYMDYLMIALAGVIYAIALKYFVLPAKVVLTGTEGISASLSYYFDSPNLFIILYAVFQFALITFAFFGIGRTFAIRSTVVVGTVVLLLAILPELRVADPDPNNERMILVIFGGLLSGVAKAMAFRSRGSTGDEDILGAYFAMKYLKPVGSIAIFAAVVSTAFGLGMAYLKEGQFETVLNTLMYTCIYIFASAETLNNLYHKFKLTMVSIITSKREVIGHAITTTSPHRTYSVQEILGGHSGDKFWMVRTILTHEELPEMLEAILAADPVSFHYYHDLEGISRDYHIPPIE